MNIGLCVIDIDQRVHRSIVASSKAIWLNKFFAFVTHFADGVIWIVIYIFSFFLFNDWFFRVILPIVIAEVMGLVIIIGLGYAVKRNRPSNGYIAHFYAPWNKYSFPSHHSLRSFVIAVAIGSTYQHIIFPLLLVASLISFSRVWLSKHYLSDVIVGALIGAILSEISMRLIA